MSRFDVAAAAGLEGGMKFYIFHPDGRCEERELPADESARLAALQEAVGGIIEFLSPAFHQLKTFDVIINDDGHGRLQPNRPGSEAIGMDLRHCFPLCGPIVLVPAEEDLEAQREADRHFFGWLDAVDVGLASAEEAGFEFVIDAR